MEKFLRNLVLPTAVIALLLVWQGESFAKLWFGPPQVEMPFPSGGNLTITPQQNLKPPGINFDLDKIDYFKDNKEYTFTLAVDNSVNNMCGKETSITTTAIIWLPILHDPVDTSKGMVELKVDLKNTIMNRPANNGTFTANAYGALGVIDTPGDPETGVYKGESEDNLHPFTEALITFAEIKEKGNSGNYFYDADPILEGSITLNEDSILNDGSQSLPFIHYKVSTLDDDDPATPTDKPQLLPWPKIGIIKVYLQVRNTSTLDVYSNASLTLFAKIDETPPQPTAVNLVYFNVNADNNGGVTLAWETATEVDNAGFNIYRARGKNGKYKKINDTIIPAQGSVSSGAQYTFEDKPPAPGVFFYKLEDVDTSGVSTMHGPEKVRVRK